MQQFEIGRNGRATENGGPGQQIAASYRRGYGLAINRQSCSHAHSESNAPEVEQLMMMAQWSVVLIHQNSRNHVYAHSMYSNLDGDG